MVETTLYWDRSGRTACARHAPLRDPETWRAQNWSEISPATVRRGKLECERCKHLRTEHDKNIRAVLDANDMASKAIARARGRSKTEAADAPLFVKKENDA